MNNFNIKINYLYNSGFAVETENFFLIFDYYLDKVNEGEKNLEHGAIGYKDLMTNKRVLVFASHSHEDHYNKNILKWRDVRGDIIYVFSSDIKVPKENSNIHTMSAYEELEIFGVKINTFGSTDIGISFLVKADGTSIFHAGDLNWWYWWDDTKSEMEQAEGAFRQELDKIKGNDVDIAFFPVDSRLRENYYKGAECFIKEIKPKTFIPMHFREDYEITKLFSEEFKKLPAKIIEIKRRGQEILV